ncbi:hypothetical protein OG912_38665 (plasmid) [Streptomyces sp. NBC_00464]|uniref:hypothetical protein n=1 Tax=Streptomyces sp. NBC_00464 TaxID=2975751 RepID=UPI002E17D2C0
MTSRSSSSGASGRRVCSGTRGRKIRLARELAIRRHLTECALGDCACGHGADPVGAGPAGRGQRDNVVDVELAGDGEGPAVVLAVPDALHSPALVVPDDVLPVALENDLAGVALPMLRGPVRFARR